MNGYVLMVKSVFVYIVTASIPPASNTLKMEFTEQQRILNLFPIPDKKLSYGTAGISTLRDVLY